MSPHAARRERRWLSLVLLASFAFVQPARAQAQDPAPASPPRGPALVTLYGSLVTLQALDAHSTWLAVHNGKGHEANPAMAAIAGHPAAMFAVKTGSAVFTIYAADKLRKRSPVAAVALMIALNSAYAAIVVHNYSVARR